MEMSDDTTLSTEETQDTSYNKIMKSGQPKRKKRNKKYGKASGKKTQKPKAIPKVR